MDLICKFCFSKAEWVCYRCRDAYCSTLCQLSDWPLHKLSCFPIPTLIRQVGGESVRITESTPQTPMSPLAVNVSTVSSAKGLSTKLLHLNLSPESDLNIHSVGRNEETEKPIEENSFKIASSLPNINGIGLTKTREISNQATGKIEPPKKVPLEPLKQTISESTKPPIPLVPLKQTTTEPPIPEEKELKAGAWMKPFPMDENVFVHAIVQYIAPDNTAWVTLTKYDAANNNLLRDINKNISASSKPDQKEVTVNSIFCVLFEGIYYRGVVLEGVSPKGTVLVRLVDFGNEFELPIGELRKPLPFMIDQKAYAFPIKFKKSRSAEIGNQIKIKKDTMKGDVLTAIVEEEDPILTMENIETVPIPVGSSTNLYCLDFSNIDKGYVCASVLDKNGLKYIDDMTSKITHHCSRSKDGYSPQVGELCLAKYEDDLWYRAVTSKVVDSDTFEILFIDYGNIFTTNSLSIRKMSDDFLHKRLMNLCYIKDFPVNSKEHARKMALYFNVHQIFEAKRVERENEKYVIHVSN